MVQSLLLWMKLICNLIISRVLVSSMTVAFQTWSPKILKKVFSVANWKIFFLYEIFYFDTFEDVDYGIFWNILKKHRKILSRKSRAHRNKNGNSNTAHVFQILLPLKSFFAPLFFAFHQNTLKAGIFRHNAIPWGIHLIKKIIFHPR